MTIAATLTVSPAAPNHGDTVTATYLVTGNTGTPLIPGTPAVSDTVSGTAVVGGASLLVTTTVTIPAVADIPAVPPLPVTYAVPTAAGLTFLATANPAVFTALVP